MIEPTPASGLDELPAAQSVLAVCAHPDDESFGLGALLSAFGAAGARTTLLCFTHGEASTLGGGGSDLGRIRAFELGAAGATLGVTEFELHDYPDGTLADEPAERLAAEVRALVRRVGADLLLVFDRGGITGHSDHQAATDAACRAADDAGLAVLAWAVTEPVARALNRELGTAFVGRAADAVDLHVRVARERQFAAIRCHASQATDNPVLWRRLELQGPFEALRWLRIPT